MSHIEIGFLPYSELGSGIKRALENWPDIDFVDDREGCLFTATVHRKVTISSEKSSEKAESSPKSSLKTEDRIIDLMKHDRFVSADSLGETLGISKRAVLKQIQKLKVLGRLKRVGPARGGHWEVVE